jgi:hypothetical protein
MWGSQSWLPPAFSRRWADLYSEIMARTKSLYGVHPSVAMTQEFVVTLKDKTGRFLDEWLALVKKSEAKTENGRRAWLKSVHGLGMNTASGIAGFAGPNGSEFATIVPLHRNHVIAQIKPATRTRIDLGFALEARKAEGRLIDTGGYAKKDRITHRIPISSMRISMPRRANG